jgi:hypothetical protein
MDSEQDTITGVMYSWTTDLRKLNKTRIKKEKKTTTLHEKRGLVFGFKTFCRAVEILREIFDFGIDSKL